MHGRTSKHGTAAPPKNIRNELEYGCSYGLEVEGRESPRTSSSLRRQRKRYIGRNATTVSWPLTMTREQCAAYWIWRDGRSGWQIFIKESFSFGHVVDRGYGLGGSPVRISCIVDAPRCLNIHGFDIKKTPPPSHVNTIQQDCIYSA